MALSFTVQAEFPQTVYGLKRHYENVVRDFHRSGELMVKVTGVQNPFSAITQFRFICKYNDEYKGKVSALTRNGKIYLFDLDRPYSSIPTDLHTFVRRGRGNTPLSR